MWGRGKAKTNGKVSSLIIDIQYNFVLKLNEKSFEEGNNLRHEVINLDE
jgi:hypothetical protein